MVGTCYTLFRMRKNLFAGLAKAFAEVRGGGTGAAETVSRTERYMSSKMVLRFDRRHLRADVRALYLYVGHDRLARMAAALVMLIVGFFFATVSGYLVGVIGSSNNPISGLTLSTLVIAALLMVVMGVNRTERRGGGAGRGGGGVRFVGGGGRTAAGFQSRLHSGRHAAHHSDRRADRRGGGEPHHVFPADGAAPGQHQHGRHRLRRSRISAPQAGLMASLAQGIVGGDMAWPLVVAGIMMGIAHDHVQGEEPHAGGDRDVSADSPLRRRFSWAA